MYTKKFQKFFLLFTILTFQLKTLFSNHFEWLFPARDAMCSVILTVCQDPYPLLRYRRVRSTVPICTGTAVNVWIAGAYHHVRMVGCCFSSLLTCILLLVVPLQLVGAQVACPWSDAVGENVSKDGMPEALF